MATFQKPENALKRAEELIDVGKKRDALETLHAALQHRKFKTSWTETIESIMVRHLGLCVELKQMRTAREGLYQYRTMCQGGNIASLEYVVKAYRKAAEDQVSEAKKEQEIVAHKLGDLEEMESPQTILFRAIQQQDTRQQSQDRDVHAHFRFLWDTYKVVLDVLKSNARLEDVYHETAKNAFEFCRANKRPQEFKRLCETMRKNWLDAHKMPSNSKKGQQLPVNPSNPDTISRTLDTRCKQLQICTELDLWRESYLTATEIHELMGKTRPKPHLRSMYYEFLGQIFWKSENHLFHAFACLKNLQFVKAAKATIKQEELQLLASKAVLATLCVPFQKQSDMHGTLELTTEGASSPYEKAKKNAQLFNAQTVPTRDSISQSLIEKTLLPLASGPCQKLFNLIESDFTPLSLCQDAKPFLDEISKGEQFDGKLLPYITPLKQIIFFRLMKQLSEVYSNMTIENFERAASIVPFSLAEKWMANAARQHGINIQINYSQKAIVFGAPRKIDMKSMRQPLIEISVRLQQAMQRVAPDEQLKKERVEKQELAQNIAKRIEDEAKMIRNRREEIERRKEESEHRKQIQDKEQMERQRKQEEREAQAEKIRMEEERVKREKDREELRKKEQQEARNRDMLEEIKKQEQQSAKASSLKIEGKKITEIDVADMTHLDPQKIIKARDAQKHRERQEKIRQRKIESKRVDHLARALREQEMPHLDRWAEEIVGQDEEYLEQAECRVMDEQRKMHQVGLEERDQLNAFRAAQEQWANAIMGERREAYCKAKEDRWAKIMQKGVDQKIKRAQDRLQKEKDDAEEAEENKRKEEQKQLEEKDEEERKEKERLEAEEQKAEEERAKAEKEKQRQERQKVRDEDDEKRNAQMERQRKREEEIEARNKTEADDKRSAPRREDRKEEDAPRRDAPRREEGGDSWRTAGAPKRETRDDDRRGGGAWGKPDDDRRRDGEGDRRRDDREDRDAPRRRDDRDDRRDDRDDRASGWRKDERDEDKRRGGDRDRDDTRRRDDDKRDDDRGGAWRRDDRDDDRRRDRDRDDTRRKDDDRRGDRDRDDRGGDKGGDWRKAPDRRDDDRDRKDAGGDWRGGGDRERRDDDRDRRRDDRDDTRRKDDDRGDRSGAWGRRGEDDSKRRDSARRDDDDRFGNLRGPAAGRAGDEEPRKPAGGDREGWRSRGRDDATEKERTPATGSSWGKGPPAGQARREEGASGDAWRKPSAPAGTRGDDDTPAKKPAAAAPARREEPAPRKAPEPAAAPEPEAGEEVADDGFAVVTGKKKKGAKK